MRVLLASEPEMGACADWGVEQLRANLEGGGHLLVNSAPDDVEFRIGRTGSALFEVFDPPVAVPGAHESFVIRSQWKDGRVLAAIAGRDACGVKLGCLDAAEQISAGTRPDLLEQKTKSPFLAIRGLYTFLHNTDIERDWLYSSEYWENWFAQMSWARFNRFNFIFGHQTAHLIPIFAHMLELEREFPEIRVEGLTRADRRRNLEALQMISKLSAEHGIEFCLGIWESRPWKKANGVWEDQPTSVTGTDNLKRLSLYTQEGMKRLLAACPYIDVIQFRMNIESGVGEQRFFVDSFVPAIREAGRPLKVELRNWGLKPETLQAFRDSGAEVIVSTKYFAEHQALPYQPPVMKGSYSYDSLPRKDRPYPLLWQVWNLGSHRLFFWGDPDYGRRLARSCKLGDGIGFDVTPPGSQKGFSQWGEVPGDWSIHNEKQGFFRWEFQRYWYFWLVFGRLGFDPTMGDEVFLKELERRFGEPASQPMFRAYRAASRLVSMIISHHMDDRNQYVWPELDCGGPIDHYAWAPPGEVTLFETAGEWAERQATGEASAKLSPEDAATRLDDLSAEVETYLREVDLMFPLRTHEEYRLTRMDFRALAGLARYHAIKIRLAANLQAFYVGGEVARLDEAERLAERALEAWQTLCDETKDYHDRLHFGPTGGHWRDNLGRVEYDLARVQQVREIFTDHGLFERGFDLGPSPKSPRRRDSVLDSEPRFQAVDGTAEYWPENGYGWVDSPGLSSMAPPRLGNELAWGVFNIRPGRKWDSDELKRIPLEALTAGYVEGTSPAKFRVDAEPGRYEVTLLASHGTAAETRLSATRGTLNVLQKDVLEYPNGVRWTVDLKGRDFVLDLRGGVRWRAHAVIVRPARPLIAHQPPIALGPESDFNVRATVTAPTKVRSVMLHYRSLGRTWRRERMVGENGRYQAHIPEKHLTGDTLEYYFVAECTGGYETDLSEEPFRVRLVRNFRRPAIARISGPETWNARGKLRFSAEVRNGEFADTLILYYREADQNKDFRTASVPIKKSGTYTIEIDPTPLDPNYEIIYYFELTNRLGSGTFAPDPFSDARYKTLRPA